MVSFKWAIKVTGRTHDIEHAVSAVYDIPHAGGLAILFPHWMRHNVKSNPTRFAKLAVNVFGVEPEGKTEEEIAFEGIERLEHSGPQLEHLKRLRIIISMIRNSN